MCPDRQILSLYHDGELPSPWKEKLEAHLASCPGCVLGLEEFRRLSETLACKEGVPEGAMDRVWARIAAAGAEKPFLVRGPRLWSRRVSLPLPAAAAAAAVLVIALIAAFRGPPQAGVPADSMAAAGMGTELQGITVDMNGILQYLGDSDTGDILIIRLPESRNFTSSGEPALLRAADYSRSTQQGPASR